MRALLLFSRIFVGSLFIVSGLIKANDPLGFSYKLEEYFAESALGLPGLEPYALTLAALACLGEIVLGFALLFGGRMKLATVSLLVLTLFFGWLTAFTARCNDRQAAGNPMTFTISVNGVEQTQDMTCVTDCGCFGDAMKGSVGRSLTPWESFTKDAVLFVFLLPILFAAWRGNGIGWNTAAEDKVLLPGGLLFVAVWSWVFTWWGPVLFTVVGYLGYLGIKRVMQGAKAELASAGWVAMLTLVFAWWCYAHLPVRDYRPYAEGKSIPEQKVMGKPPVVQTYVIYRNKTTGESKEYDAAGAYPWDDENFEYVDRRIVEVEPGILSPVSDFLLTDKDGYDMTNDLLAEQGPVMLVMMYNAEKSDRTNLPVIAKLAAEANAAGWYVYGVSASGWEAIEEVRHEHQLPFDFVQCDEKTIKTAVRANPGVMVLKAGTVKGLWHGNDTPSFEEAKARVQ